MQYHQGQSTLPRLAGLLHSVGVSISKRQVQRLLTDKREGFVSEARAVLRAGLETSPYVSVDDTGARHAGKNGFCTQIGNDWFTWFGTRPAKSRLSFLDLLRAGHADYVLNDAAYGHMRKHALSAPLIARLMAEPQTRFADEAVWLAHLERLGFTALTVTPDPVRVATEGALWGSVQSHQFLCDAVVLSDDAGQFNVGRHALCWIHAERLVHQLDTFTDQQRVAQARVRGLIWNFYASLKAYQLNPTRRRSNALRARFDRIFLRRTGFATLDRLLARLHANKAELLTVLDRPEIPLHTNGSENDIRCHVTRRKVSGGTRSDIGRDCRDAFLSLAKTWPRPATNSASRSGTTWAADSRSRDTHSSNRSTITSGRESDPPDRPQRPHFCPSYVNFRPDLPEQNTSIPQLGAARFREISQKIELMSLHRLWEA